MFTRSLPLRVVLVALVVLCACNSWSRADEKEEPSPGVVAIALHENLTEGKIRQELQERTTVEFLETPLEDVLNFLEDLHDLSIVVDKRALEEIGVDTSEPITINLDNVSLRSALDLILSELDLTFVITSEVLMITSIEEEQTMLSVMVYPVGHLLPSVDEEDARQALIEVITTTVAPMSWSRAGGAGTIVGYHNAIVASNTRETHEGILALLRALSKVPDCGPRPSASADDIRPRSEDAGGNENPFGDSE